MSVLESGETIADRYVVLGRLGSGGMATVYQCTDTQTGDHVALKLLHDHLMADNPEIVARFRREARLMTRLSEPRPHPNIVAVRQVITRPTQLGIVMELVDGAGTLDRYLETHQQLAESTAIEILTGILAGLQFIHEQGIIHRDLKPSNILLGLSKSGRLVPKIGDFGIAKLENRPDEDSGFTSTLTQTQSMFGSPAYMAPELFDSATSASTKSDLYAVGILLYEILTGTVPFVVDAMPSHVMRVSSQPVPTPRTYCPELSGDLEHAIYVALAKDPAERFESAHSFVRALQGEGVDVGDEKALLSSDQDPTRIARDYKVQRRIGRGPTCSVYKCVDESLNVPVAIKLLRGNDPERRARLLEEAKAQASLHQGRTHSGIAAIRHVVAQDSITALVLEYVEGLALDRYVSEARPDLATVLELFSSAAEALSHGHELGVLHRNLKPSNVLVSWTGGEAAERRKPKLKLSDFRLDTVSGLSRLELARKTKSENFLAPELWGSNGVASESSDVFALGALMLLALQGRLPETSQPGPRGQALRAAIPRVSPWLRDLLEASLSESSADRPSARTMFEALQKGLGEMTGERGPVSAIEITPPAPKEGSGLFLWAALVLVAMALLGVGGWLLGSQEGKVTTTVTSSPTEPPEPVVEDVAAEVIVAELDVGPELAPEPTFIDVSGEVAKLLAGKTEEVINPCLMKAFRHKKAAKLKNEPRSLKIKVYVDADGVFQSAEALKDDLDFLGLGDCVVEKLQALTFPPSGREESYEKEWFF